MKCGISTAYKRASQSQKRSKPSASAGPEKLGDLRPHPLPPVPDPQLGAVREDEAIHRVDRAQHEVRHFRSRGGEGSGEQVEHGEHRRSGVQPVPLLGDHAGAPAHPLPLDDLH